MFLLAVQCVLVCIHCCNVILIRPYDTEITCAVAFGTLLIAADTTYFLYY